MDNFYIITNKLKDADFCITNEILEYIRQNGKTGILSQKDEEGNIIAGTIPEGMDCALVLGGGNFHPLGKGAGGLQCSDAWR